MKLPFIIEVQKGSTETSFLYLVQQFSECYPWHNSRSPTWEDWEFVWMPILELHLQLADLETLEVGSSNRWPNSQSWEPAFKPRGVEMHSGQIRSKWSTGIETIKYLVLIRVTCWKTDFEPPKQSVYLFSHPEHTVCLPMERDNSSLADFHLSAYSFSEPLDTDDHTGNFR